MSSNAPSPLLPRPEPRIINVDRTIASKSGARFPVKGFVAPGFEAVGTAFEKNFAEDRELGSSCCVYHRGRVVVDLVGGWRDTARTVPYDFGTIHVVHSSGKILAAIVAVQSIGLGAFEYDDRIAYVWPEFGVGGKEKVTVKELLEHSAELTLTENLPKLAELIAKQPHNHGGKTTRAYHAITKDWFLGEVIRRTRGASIGQIMLQLGHELGTRAYCGLPPAADAFRCPVVDSDFRRTVDAATPADNPAARSLNDSQPIPTEPTTVPGGINSNNLSILRGESASGFCVTNGHGLATYAAVMANGGWLNGKRVVSHAAWERAFRFEEENRTQRDLHVGLVLSVTHSGMVKSNPGTNWPQVIIDYSDVKRPRIKKYPPVPKEKEFTWYGWFGLGGSHIQCNPDYNVAAGYAPNLLEPGINGDERGRSICVAIAESVLVIEAGSGKESKI
ncbi:beta-lactamase/transpeptidase-like protein [Hyaloraphidium curvatum]|nr:beta-lactamase/transpeptidase-like protein [Hyaloraphidium curvatum]